MMYVKQEAIVSGEQIRNMLLGAYQGFTEHQEFINNLNVFPVPDGDTGTNMMKTMAAVARDITPLQNPTASEVGSVAARSAVMGARGNSGVILSQLLRGIGKGLAGKQRATSNEMGKAFQFGILYAYRAVSKPVEGTILTVARAIAKGAYQAVRRGENFVEVLEEAIASGKVELARTPDMLPALKAAGVVDAGGQGLIVFLEGCLAGFTGERITTSIAVEPSATVQKASASTAVTEADIEDLTTPYCTEFIVKGAHVTEKAVRDELNPLGNSLIVAVMEDIVKVHIHTADPGDVLHRAVAWGSLHDIKIDNMAEQHEHRVIEANTNPTKQGLGIVSVAAGDGIAEIMRQLGADGIVGGGQSMNPPVEDFIEAINNGKHSQYIILPNNKNIILAAEQVRKILGSENVDYIPTKNLAQGLAALIRFDAEKDIRENVRAMRQDAMQAHCVSVSVAVRDSVVNGVEVKKGQYIGLAEDKIVYAGNDLEEVTCKTVALAGEDWEIISIYYGSDINEEIAEAIADKLLEIAPDAETQIFNGAQPLYPLILSLE